MSEYRLIPLRGKYGRGKFAKVDPEDYEWLSRYKWHLNGGYVYRSAYSEGKIESFAMHREVTKPPPDMLVDHANHDLLDNRKENLRVCSRLENSRNRLANPRKYKGVYERGTGALSWCALIRVDGKNVWLGLYDSPEDAARAYDKAALSLFGDFAHTNFGGSEAATVEEVLAQAAAPKFKRDTSQYRGVCKKKGRNSWVASATVTGKSYYFGNFTTELEAAKAYDAGILQLKGEKAQLNFP